ncbi:MAG: UDP-3-O-(3-hydroxymyristoyl)glucosamine N-acyltransferase [Candidatus Kryptoniota bacterium]
MKISNLARLTGAEVEGNGDLEIYGIAKIEEAKEGDVTFLANPKYEKFVQTTRASAIFVSENFKSPRKDIVFLRTKDPYVAFVKALKVLIPQEELLPRGINSSAYISPKAILGRDVSIGAFVVISDGSKIGDRTVISHGAVIGRNVTVGDDSVIYPNVSIYNGCRVGNRVIIHSGTVIGSDGFGFAQKEDGTYEKIPQVGVVVIEDDVEIGSNCTIDRATMGETRIGRGVKIDNLVQVAHNVEIGEHTVVAAQTGISGSTRIGKYCVIAGQVGFVGHIEIADHTTVAAQSGISKSILEGGRTYFGYPAKEIHEARRIEGAIRMLPKLLEEFREMQKKLEELKLRSKM